MTGKKTISIVIPAYNEADNIPVITQQIAGVFESLSKYNYEIVFVADGCTDNTVDVINQLCDRYNVFYIELSRNFGQQLALKAGMDHATGACIVNMDCDLQHPTTLIPELILKWEEGYEVVYTIRKEDKRLPFGKRMASRIYYKVLNKLSSVHMEPGSADFRLIDRKVAEVLKRFGENEPYLRGIIKWTGFSQYAVCYYPDKRSAGETKYNTRKLFSVALQGIMSFSIKPLYLMVYLGFIFSILSTLYVPYVMYSFYSGREVSGWGSLIMTVVFFGGLQLTILGILGIYIGKMFMQTKARPAYIVRSTNIKITNRDTAEF